ncbi:MAG: NUDIX domain-containing protein [Arhodomonas sp.]|nr:NUDIX domain-containing protein [Arhodomonas sp.]
MVAAIAMTPAGRMAPARDAEWPPGKFGLVTGFLEPGEGPEEGMVREVAEELCVAGRIRAFQGLYPFHRNNQLLIVYQVDLAGEPSAGEELSEIRCLLPERVPALAAGHGAGVCMTGSPRRGLTPRWIDEEASSVAGAASDRHIGATITITWREHLYPEGLPRNSAPGLLRRVIRRRGGDQWHLLQPAEAGDGGRMGGGGARGLPLRAQVRSLWQPHETS